MKAEAVRTDRQTPETLAPEGLIKSLSDVELVALVELGKTEIAARERRRKEETIAKIRELASAAGLSVAIEGARGRPGGRVHRRKESEPSAKPTNTP